MTIRPAASPLSVVAVHGVGNNFGADLSESRTEELRALRSAAWARELSSGLGIEPGCFDVDFAYYADHLSSGPARQGRADGFEDPLAQELFDAWAHELQVPHEVSQGHATVPLRAFTAWLARRFDLAEGPLRVFIRMLFPEVASYLRTEGDPQRVAAREAVAVRIARQRPRVVIAHSLGSVVAYEALHAHPELRPELFLTLGSPLALPRAVFERLLPSPQGIAPALRGARPPGVARWVNIADPGDPVAIPPGLGAFFDGVALDHTAVVGFHFDFHHAKNYLRSSTTAATLAPYLG